MRSCPCACPAIPDSALAPSPATARTASSGNTGGPAVLVNELHYDNIGTDIGEAVELAGPSGTDLTGWTLFACNRATGAAYHTRPLGDTLPGQQAGFGILTAWWWWCEAYEELGPDHYTQRDPQRTRNRALRDLESLGYEVVITPVAA